MPLLTIARSEIRADDGALWAAVSHRNPLRRDPPEPLLADPAVPAAPPGPARVVAWSGTLADGLFEPDPRTWAAPGWTRFDELCDDLAPEAQRRGILVCFRTHAAHILSDVPSCLRFLQLRALDPASSPFRILLDPAAMLTEAMLPAAEDHLRRIFASLAGRPALAGILLSNLARTGDPDAPLAPAPLTRGLLSPDLLAELAAGIAARDAPPADAALPIILPEDPAEPRAARDLLVARAPRR